MSVSPSTVNLTLFLSEILQKKKKNVATVLVRVRFNHSFPGGLALVCLQVTDKMIQNTWPI